MKQGTAMARGFSEELELLLLIVILGCWPARLPCPLRSRRVVDEHPTEANR